MMERNKLIEVELALDHIEIFDSNYIHDCAIRLINRYPYEQCTGKAVYLTNQNQYILVCELHHSKVSTQWINYGLQSS